MAVEINYKWVDQQSYIEFAISSLINALIKKTLFELVYGHKMHIVAT